MDKKTNIKYILYSISLFFKDLHQDPIYLLEV